MKEGEGGPGVVAVRGKGLRKPPTLSFTQYLHPLSKLLVGAGGTVQDSRGLAVGVRRGLPHRVL